MYATDVLKYLTACTHNAMDAEDMLHDIFLKVITLDIIEMDNIRNMLFVAAKRMIIDHARHWANIRRYEQEAYYELENKDNFSIIRKLDACKALHFENILIEKMPERRARIYTLRFHDDMSSQEIAKTLGMNQRTVEGHIYQSRKLMREYLRKVM